MLQSCMEPESVSRWLNLLPADFQVVTEGDITSLPSDFSSALETLEKSKDFADLRRLSSVILTIGRPQKVRLLAWAVANLREEEVMAFCFPPEDGSEEEGEEDRQLGIEFAEILTFIGLVAARRMHANLSNSSVLNALATLNFAPSSPAPGEIRQ